MLHNLWAWHPPVGVWIGILGLLGVVVPLIWDIAKMGKREKALWTFVMFALLGLELKTVYQDRREHDQQQAEARAEQLSQFRAIADGIAGNLDAGEREYKAITEQNQQQFTANMTKSEAIIRDVADSIKTQTGGDSFAFISFTAQPAQSFEMHWNNFVAPKGDPYFVVSITSHGKYPLRSTHATIMDDDRRLAAMQEYNKHPNGNFMQAINSADIDYQIPYLRPQSPEAPTGEVDVIGLYPMPQANSKRLTIAFASLNGYWNEVLHLGRVNGEWHQCLSLLGPTVRQIQRPFVYCDSPWPEGKAIAEKDWQFPKPQKKN